jgi:hypothetical protein
VTLSPAQRESAIQWLVDLPLHILREKIARAHSFGSGATYSDKSKIMEVLQQTACLAEMLLARCDSKREADSRLSELAPDLLAIVARVARQDPIFAKGADKKQLIAAARALVEKANGGAR